MWSQIEHSVSRRQHICLKHWRILRIFICTCASYVTVFFEPKIINFVAPDLFQIYEHISPDYILIVEIFLFLRPCAGKFESYQIRKELDIAMWMIHKKTIRKKPKVVNSYASVVWEKGSMTWGITLCKNPCKRPDSRPAARLGDFKTDLLNRKNLFIFYFDAISVPVGGSVQDN